MADTFCIARAACVIYINYTSRAIYSRAQTIILQNFALYF